MPRRKLLTPTERLQLLAFPEDAGELIRVLTLSKADIAFVRQHRGDHNRFGIAVLMDREVLGELARAIADGTRVRAFHAWTLLDNFQWGEGYTELYGLIYTDFRNQKRTIKDSGLWYGRVAASNRLDV